MMKRVYLEEQDIKSLTLKSNNKNILHSYVRTWIDRNAQPYKYEFRGNFMGYLNPEDISITKGCI